MTNLPVVFGEGGRHEEQFLVARENTRGASFYALQLLATQAGLDVWRSTHDSGIFSTERDLKEAFARFEAKIGGKKKSLP